ncbi:MAG: ribosome maturation factor RimP [Mariprofundus sp.]
MESIIESLLQPIADELGVDILKISLGSGGHSQLLRVVVDRAGGIDSDGLERISRGLALQLDAEDLIKGAFRLEVTSPGLDWPLQSEADFRRHQDEWIHVQFLDGSSQEGRNLGPVASEDGVRFSLLIEARKSSDNRETVIDMAEVSKVVRAINWSEVSRKTKGR